MRKALIVGINDYSFGPLTGCVNDGEGLANLLKTNEDGSPNFECKLITAPSETVTRESLTESVAQLLQTKADVALFYFSGHGTVNDLGGYLVTPDAKRYSEGLALRDLLGMANDSKAHEVVIIIDTCHSGALGQLPGNQPETALLREGISILTASRKEEPALEKGGHGLFTSLVLAALQGGASDVEGKVTAASVYTFVDEVLGAWDQRPLFKCHISHLLPLRRCRPIIEPKVLRLLPKYFPAEDYDFKLDPSYEDSAEPRDPEHESIFKHLQQYRAARLLIPIGEDHLYWAAMHSKSCALTSLGKFYWTLAKNGRI